MWEVITGDCLEVMPGLGRVDAVITDPPYGDSETHAKHLSTATDRQTLGFSGIEEKSAVELMNILVEKSASWVVATFEWHYMEALHRAGLLVRFGIWRKPNGAPQFTGDRPGTGWEAVAICHGPGKKRWNGGGKHAFWEFNIENRNSGHPTEKPLPLMRRLVVDFTDPGATVLDPFCGSGTTGVACVETGRSFIGIEIDPGYADIARRRIDEASRQQRLF